MKVTMSYLQKKTNFTADRIMGCGTTKETERQDEVNHLPSRNFWVYPRPI